MNRYFFLARFKEPSTWAALAATAAIVTGHDPTTTVSMVTQVAGGIAALAGIFLSENTPSQSTGKLMETLQEILLHLGQIQGALEAIANRQEEMTRWLDGMDSRLRVVEIKAALWGIASGGGVMAVVHFLKS